MSEKDLKKAKEHLIGNLYLSLETSDELAYFYGGQETLGLKLTSPQELARKVNKITANDIRKVMREVVRNDGLNLALIGPFKKRSFLDSESMKTEVAWGTLWRIFTFMAGITLVYFAWDAFAVLLVGVVISMGIDPFVTFLAEKARIGRVFAAIFVILAIISVFAGGIYIIAPVIFEELAGFLSHFTQSVTSVFHFGNFSWSLESLNIGSDQILNFISGAGNSVPGAISKLLKCHSFLFFDFRHTLFEH